MAWNIVQIKVDKDTHEVNQHTSNPLKFAFSSAVHTDGLKTFSCGDQTHTVVSITDVANRGEEYIVETIQGEQSGKSSKRGDSD
tara:strand:+ start:387 stop:638 length:252 start_codon:yes stop_codon:yes gene_type:complete